jgi:hypothetical protein
MLALPPLPLTSLVPEEVEQELFFWVSWRERPGKMVVVEV